MGACSRGRWCSQARWAVILHRPTVTMWGARWCPFVRKLVRRRAAAAAVLRARESVGMGRFTNATAHAGSWWKRAVCRMPAFNRAMAPPFARNLPLPAPRSSNCMRRRRAPLLVATGRWCQGCRRCLREAIRSTPRTAGSQRDASCGWATARMASAAPVGTWQNQASRSTPTPRCIDVSVARPPPRAIVLHPTSTFHAKTIRAVPAASFARPTCGPTPGSSPVPTSSIAPSDGCQGPAAGRRRLDCGSLGLTAPFERARALRAVAIGDSGLGSGTARTSSDALPAR